MFDGQPWSEIQKQWQLVRGKTVLKLKKRRNLRHSSKARRILQQYGRSLKRCDVCGAIHHIQVHHRDSNPTNNLIENLQVLCKKCHYNIHNRPFGFLWDMEGIPYVED